MKKQTIVIICGPTASGKSRLAQEVARRHAGVVINADSMQLYRELRILTARPTLQEETEIPHRLYGYVPAAERYSVNRWLQDVKTEVKQCIDGGLLPIIVGGTGLYLTALMEGLSPIPDVPPEVRKEVKTLYETLGEGAFRSQLAAHDPEIAQKLKKNDAQRLKRAMEVWLATGTPLSIWQKIQKEPIFPEARFQLWRMDIPRDVLYARCDARFDAMIEQGVLEEVRAIAGARLDESLPAMKSLGLPELLAHLRGEVTLEEAVIKAKQATRNYAKRQLTWIRNQLPQSEPVPYDVSLPQWKVFTEKLRKFVDPLPLNQ